MEKYEVKNIYGKKGSLSVRVPGSKSITNRALLTAALAEGESLLDGILFSDDTRYFMGCLKALGIKTEISEALSTARIFGCGGKLPVKTAEINVGSAGTAARFITALLAVCDGEFFIDSSEQMKKRPMKPLLDSLTSLGAEIEYKGAEGFFPFVIKGKTPDISSVEVDIDKSSQFLSALLIVSPLFKNGADIAVKGTHGMNYVKITADMMADFGVKTEQTVDGGFKTDPGQHYIGRYYEVEADLSAACYFYAVAAVLGISVTVKNVFKNTVQGDIGFIKVLEEMGCSAEETEGGICLTGPKDGGLKGVEADLSGFSDQALTLAAIAPYASTPTTIKGIAHIRGQECDRINAITQNLKAMGVKTEETEDSVKIYPSEPKPCEVETFNDHRVAMSFALTGLRSDGIVIKNPSCCKKTFENYFDVLDSCINALI
ncbi:MAG: 3-phosphoshikimate 1-carboxyvinyltransferase [Eubacterium sp.]|nr:3-phosphoshikimate 1-carboxyvinyltransferase [Eubacterium sp.]